MYNLVCWKIFYIWIKSVLGNYETTLYSYFLSGDIDFVVYGCDNLIQLEDDLQQIETLRKIDIFDFDSIKNEYLLEDIKKYGKQIY